MRRFLWPTWGGFVIFALLATLVVVPAQSTAAHAWTGLSPDAYLNSDGSLSLPADFNGSFDLTGWDVRLDPERGPMLQPAAIDATLGEWSSIDGVATNLGAGEGVYGMVVYNDIVYAVGSFTGMGGVIEVDNVAQLSGGAWGKVGAQAASARVWDAIVNQGILYVGGEFNTIYGTANTARVAQFNIGTNAWSGMGTGLNNAVEALAASGGTIYVGGSFTDAGGVLAADRIATFSGGSWGALGNGISNGSVYTIRVNGGKVYAGGSFTNAGGDANADRIAVFDGASWGSLGGANTGLNSSVRQIRFESGVLYAGGEFTNAGGDADADYVARYSGGTWAALSNQTLNNIVQGMAVRNGVVYVGGNFTDAGSDADADYVAKFEDGVLSSLNGPGSGLDDTVVDLRIFGDTLYAGGNFSDAGGDSNADRIAVFGLPPINKASSTGGAVVNKDIAGSGTTTLYTGRFYVSVPASALPPGAGDCHLAVQKKDDSGAYGFSLDDQVWDVKIVCDGAPVSILYAPITVCIRPLDGVTSNKQLFHRHSSAFNALPETGALSGYVCGQTQVLSLFTLGSLALPATGFAPGIQSALPTRSAANSYTATDLTLDIPELDLHLDIVGVPQNPNGWDVSWLAPSQAGYLYGSAFPTMAGNTVLTAHVWNADNSPGPFARLAELGYGDRFTITAWGATYTYEVRSNALYSPSSLRPLAHEDYDWVTLMTCDHFDEATGSYVYRRAVRAVLVAVE